MSSLLTIAESRMARIRALAAPAGARDYVISVLDQRLGEATTDLTMGVVPLPLPSSRQLLGSARLSAEYLDDPERLISRPEGIVDLGTIEWCLRPALPIRDGRIQPPTSPPWNDLDPSLVQSSSRRVCRIDLGLGGHEPFHLGTGFVIGPRERDAYRVVTNAHVLMEATRLGWQADADMDLYADFDRTSIVHAGQLHLLRRAHAIHSVYDLAVLYLTASDSLAYLDETALTVSPVAPNPTVNARIGVLGHPHFDSRRDLFPQRFGFGDQYGIKRFAPGFIRAMEKRSWLKSDVEVFLHDASTLSGSSGSCILNLQSHEVVGLHFGGWPTARRPGSTLSDDFVAQLFEANGAVPMWKVVQDPVFQLPK